MVTASLKLHHALGHDWREPIYLGVPWLWDVIGGWCLGVGLVGAQRARRSRPARANTPTSTCLPESAEQGRHEEGKHCSQQTAGYAYRN